VDCSRVSASAITASAITAEGFVLMFFGVNGKLIAPTGARIDVICFRKCNEILSEL
jgi:hypothetical protein